MTSYQPTQSEILNYDPNEQFTYPEPSFKLNKSLANVLAIDNLPLTEASKAEKMSTVIQKVFEKKASIVPIDFYMPIDEATGQTKGFAFVEFATPTQAKSALEKVQGFAFTKKNDLVLYSVSDWEKYETFDENTVEKPTAEPFKEQEDLSTWLSDEQARDQYAIKHHDTVQVLWNDPHHKLVNVHSREHWTDDAIMWSPQGSYLVTFHKKGLALWGGENWKIQSSLSFKNVRLCHFSPNEKYVVAMNDDPRDNVAIFDVRTKKKEIFTANDIIARLPEGRWPVFHWSYDSKYFARLGGDDELEVYESSTMKLLGGKPLRIDGIQTFSWCPNKNIIAYWSPEYNGIPAKIALMEIPKLREVRSKNLFKVLNVQMVWHPDGDYLSAAVDSEVVKKSVKVKQTTLELFRMNQKGVPVEVQEVKETLITVAWEPKGDRFAIIHGDQQLKKHVSFYTMNGPNQSCKLLKMLEPKQVDSLFWSPRGINLVVANTKSSTATLEFWDADALEPIGYGEHFGMTNASWDPTGRYFCTYVSAHKRAADLGFIIWTFLGRTLHKNNIDMLYEFHWRPRPPTLLTPVQEKKVKKNFRELAKQIEKEVKARDEKVKEGLLKERQEQWDEFMEFLARIKEEYAEMKEERAKIRGYESDEDEWYDIKEETVEQVVEVIEEEVTN